MINVPASLKIKQIVLLVPYLCNGAKLPSNIL